MSVSWHPSAFLCNIKVAQRIGSQLNTFSTIERPVSLAKVMRLLSLFLAIFATGRHTTLHGRFPFTLENDLAVLM